MEKKVLVTGAGGFIGANLARALLARGDQVHILSRTKNFQWRLSDIKSKLKPHYIIEINDRTGMSGLIKSIQPEQVFHLAQYGGNPGEDDPVMVEKVMVAGTAAVFESCAEVSAIKSIVNIGSFLEYGEKSASIKESMPLQPNTVYGCAKAWSTLYGQYLAKQKSVPITTLRPTFVFGPWQQAGRFIAAAILSSLSGKPVKISNLNTVRDFIFVDDVIKAIILAADRPCPGEVINIGFGKQMTLKKTADMILKFTKSDSGIELGITGRSFDKSNAVWQADISKAKKLLGWKPKFSQKEAIIKTIEWFNESKKLYKTNI